MCDAEKPLTDFHKQASGKFGRHSYCADCFNAWKRLTRPTTHEGRGVSADTSKRWNLKARYGLSPVAYEEMLTAQGGVCAICGEEPKRPCVDHNHNTGQVRGILCHHCNIRLASVENDAYRIPALAYLKRYAPSNDNEPEEARHAARK